MPNVFVMCVCVCVSVQATTFEAVDTETSFLLRWYILTVSSVEVIGSMSRS